MEKISTRFLLEKYRGWLEQGDILFLERSPKKQEVLKYIQQLQEVMKKEGEPEFQWHEAHNKGRALWEKLASCSLNDIDTTSKGNSKLFKFLQASAKFEELLYGAEPYYRDHTLHSLWVYLIGEYILRIPLTDIGEDLNWYLINDIRKEQDKYLYPSSLVKYSQAKERDIIDAVKEHREAIWCIMALCHDLGYSLAKLGALNEKVRAVLEFFEIPDFRHIGYSLDIEQQYLITQFLELIAMDIHIVPSEDYEKLRKYENKKKYPEFIKLNDLELSDFIKEIKAIEEQEDKPEYVKKLDETTRIKCYRDDGQYWVTCKALEQKRHGILGSYLIYKILSIFADAPIRGPAEEWGLDDNESVDIIIRGNILFAIAQHDFDFAYLYELGSLADILIIADELEEFSRLGRELYTRKYEPTMAESSIGFEKTEDNGKKLVKISFVYEVKEPRSLIDFFIDKTQRLCRFYSLDTTDEKSEFHRINEINMTAKKDNLDLTFSLNMDPKKNEGKLPRKDYKGNNEGDAVDTFALLCYEDKIHVITNGGEETELSEWFREMDNAKWKKQKDDWKRLKSEWGEIE